MTLEEGRIQVALADVALPFIPLQDGPLATVTFVTSVADGEEITLDFADDYPVSFGSTSGTSVPVSAEGGPARVTAPEPAGEEPEPTEPEPTVPEPETPVEPEPESPEPTAPLPPEPIPAEPSPTEPETEVPETEEPAPEAPEQTPSKTFLPVAPK